MEVTEWVVPFRADSIRCPFHRRRLRCWNLGEEEASSSRAFFVPRIRCVHLHQIVAQLFGCQVVCRRLT